MSRAQEVVAYFGGHWYGRYGRCRCPVHNGDGDSLQIRDKLSNRDGVDCHCFRGCDWREVKAELARRGLIEGQPDAAPRPDPEAVRKMAEQERQEREKRHRRAVMTWERARPGKASPEVETYLRSRAIDLDRIGGVPDALRYSPECYHGLTGGFHPAMVAAITDATGRLAAVHQTYLIPGGTAKARLEKPKLILGSCGGSAVRLFPVKSEMGVAEGVETALSAHELTGVPTWAALNSSGLIGLMVPPSIRRVVIFADYDPVDPRTGERPGTAAAESLAARLKTQWVDCEIRYPAGGLCDFNDQLRERKAA